MPRQIFVPYELREIEEGALEENKAATEARENLPEAVPAQQGSSSKLSRPTLCLAIKLVAAAGRATRPTKDKEVESRNKCFSIAKVQSGG